MGGLTLDLLEKSMLFIPNRLFIRENGIYVSFNIAGIPSDMLVTSMTIKIPLSEGTEGILHLHEITAGWDEQYIKEVLPAYSPAINAMHVSSEMPEASFALTRFSHPWRFRSLENHGVYITLESVKRVAFSERHMPYLLVNTV